MASPSDLTGAVLYRPPSPIAGVRPYFMLPRQEDVSYFDSCGGAPEAPLIAWATSLLPQGALFVDCGAHVGTWGITFACLKHRVMAFEAQPWLARLCNAGFCLNGLPALCSPLGLSDEAGSLTLSAPHTDGGGGSIVRDFGSSAPLRMEVQTTTLDAVAPQDVKLVKIDVEAAELKVLLGALATIRKWRPKILFECWDDERGQRKEELFRYIRDTLRYKAARTTWSEVWIADPMETP